MYYITEKSVHSTEAILFNQSKIITMPYSHSKLYSFQRAITYILMLMILSQILTSELKEMLCNI